ncbi:unnamed protein product [Closterium sp. Naga37s-1]|nr:unnamed protein product [Closterium sp. Naga37s-1]
MEALKQKGNEAFKKGQFSAAALAYRRALEAAAESGEAPRETASLHSNLSCSLLKLGHREEVEWEGKGENGGGGRGRGGGGKDGRGGWVGEKYGSPSRVHPSFYRHPFPNLLLHPIPAFLSTPAFTPSPPSLHPCIPLLPPPCALACPHAPQALEAAQQCTELREEWNKGWFRKGEALFALQRYDEAEEAYRQALDRAPDDATVKQCLLLALEAQQGFLLRQVTHALPLTHAMHVPCTPTFPRSHGMYVPCAMFAGREFCVGRGRNVIESQIYRSAQQMRNFIYLVGDAHSREAVVVDGAWDVEGILRFAEAERVKLVGAVVTHYHFDHTGGMPPPPFDALGIKVPGIRELAAAHGLKVYANKHDAALLQSKNGVPSDSIVEVQDGATIEVGAVSLRFIHTPGHTPGSQCIHIERAPGHDDGVLISGDTLFIGSCGRLDLPDCNREAMYDSLQKLAALPPDTSVASACPPAAPLHAALARVPPSWAWCRVYPGHDYGGAFTSIGKEKATGFLRPMTKQQWLASQAK